MLKYTEHGFRTESMREWQFQHRILFFLMNKLFQVVGIEFHLVSKMTLDRCNARNGPHKPTSPIPPDPKRKKCHLSQKCQRTQIDLTQEILEAGRKEFGVLECTQAHRNQGLKNQLFSIISPHLLFFFSKLDDYNLWSHHPIPSRFIWTPSPPSPLLMNSLHH